MRHLLFIAGLAVTLLSGCGSMRNVGPFYVANTQTCIIAGQEKPCDSDSTSVASAKEKLSRHEKHFTEMADARANKNFTVGNVGIGASLVGVVSAVSQYREGVIASALVGIPTTLFGQRYNLSGQSAIYLRGARNFQCMRNSLREVEEFLVLYDKLTIDERSQKLVDAWQSFQELPLAVDRRMDDVVMRTRTDLINGVATVDTAMITSTFERYATDLKAAQDKIGSGTLVLPPKAAAPADDAKAVPPAPSLTKEQEARLQILAVRIEALPAALDKCIAQ